jgi:branched-chain amino acid transport system permease protein
MIVDVLVMTIFLSSTSALMALSLTIVYNSTRVINFSQGEIFILGCGMAYQIGVVMKLNMFVVAAVAIPVTALAGLLLERLIMIPVRRSGSPVAWIITTLSITLISQSLFALAFTSAQLRPDPLLAGGFKINGQELPYQILILLAVTLVIFFAYEIFLNKTTFGIGVRAAATDPETTSTFGVPVKLFVAGSFMAAGLIAGIGGWLGSSAAFVLPTDGLRFTVAGFVAMIVGGLGSTRGALIGGFVVGAMDAILRNTINPGIGELFIAAILVIILVFRPQGIIGAARTRGDA